MASMSGYKGILLFYLIYITLIHNFKGLLPSVRQLLCGPTVDCSTSLSWKSVCKISNKKQTPWPLVRKGTIPTEWPPLGEISRSWIYVHIFDVLLFGAVYLTWCNLTVNPAASVQQFVWRSPGESAKGTLAMISAERSVEIEWAVQDCLSGTLQTHRDW
jgi:hypothetical protein